MEGVHVRDEIGDVLVGRLQDDTLGLAVLHDAPTFHDGDVVAELQGLVEIVADEDDGFLEAGLQLEELVLQPRADQRVQRRKRLVHEQDVGIGGESAGEPHALLHTT